MRFALPAMQRNQRDTQRRNDYSALETAVINYLTNNNGRFPSVCTSTLSAGSASANSGICASTLKYINSQDQGGTTGYADDPSGNDYALNVIKYTSDSAFEGVSSSPWGNNDGTGDGLDTATTTSGSLVYVVQQADCSGKDKNDQSTPKYKKGSRNFAIYGQLENGTYCAESK